MSTREQELAVLIAEQEKDIEWGDRVHSFSLDATIGGTEDLTYLDTLTSDGLSRPKLRLQDSTRYQGSICIDCGTVTSTNTSVRCRACWSVGPRMPWKWNREKAAAAFWEWRIRFGYVPTIDAYIGTKRAFASCAGLPTHMTLLRIFGDWQSLLNETRPGASVSFPHLDVLRLFVAPHRFSARQLDILRVLSTNKKTLSATDLGEYFRHDSERTWIDYSDLGMRQAIKGLTARNLVSRRTQKRVIGERKLRDPLYKFTVTPAIKRAYAEVA